MRAIAPRTGAPEVTIAEDQHGYLTTVGAAYYDSNLQSDVILTRWTLTDEERLAVAEGADIYLGLATFGKPMQPIQLTVGPQHWTVPEGT